MITSNNKISYYGLSFNRKSTSKLNGSSNAIKVKTSSETSGGTASNSRLPTVTTLSKTQLKVTQCLVLFIILVLVVILCSVFIRPEIFFSDYGKQF